MTDFFHLLILMTGVGGFLGEAYRLPTNMKLVSTKFAISVLAGSFLAFLAGWAWYERTGNRNISLILSGLISFQDIEKLAKASRSIILKNLSLIEKLLKGGDDYHSN